MTNMSKNPYISMLKSHFFFSNASLQQTLFHLECFQPRHRINKMKLIDMFCCCVWSMKHENNEVSGYRQQWASILWKRCTEEIAEMSELPETFPFTTENT